MDRCRHNKREEISVIPLANTVADPWAMMVVHLDAGIAGRAVKRSRWLVTVASAALGDGQLMVTDHRVVDDVVSRSTRSLALPLLILCFFAFCQLVVGRVSRDDARVTQRRYQEESETCNHSQSVHRGYQVVP